MTAYCINPTLFCTWALRAGRVLISRRRDAAAAPAAALYGPLGIHTVQELQADDRSQVSIAQLTLVVPHCMSTCHEARARSVAWSSRPPVRSLSSSRARCAAKNPPAPERLTQATAFAFGSGRMADKQCKAVGISRHCAFVLTLLAKSNVLRNLRNEGSILPLDKKWNERCAASTSFVRSNPVASQTVQEAATVDRRWQCRRPLSTATINHHHLPSDRAAATSSR
eukprot:COSAG06_NODE_456_length_15511_cov_7.299312_2_plen_225_part_00